MKRTLLILPTFLFILSAVEARARSNRLQTRTAIVAAKTFGWMVNDQIRWRRDPAIVWIYTILMRRFNLPELDAVRFFKRGVRDGLYSNSDEALILNVIVPDVRDALRLEKTKTDSINSLLFASMYCATKALPSDYLQRVEKMAQKGGYELTHMYLILIILREKRCREYLQQEQQYLQLEKKLEPLVLTLSTQARIINDLDIEAAAFISYGNPALTPPDSYLRRVIDAAEQHLDNPYVSKMSAHTVVLLLWYLLERTTFGTDKAKRIELAPISP